MNSAISETPDGRTDSWSKPLLAVAEILGEGDVSTSLSQSVDKIAQAHIVMHC